MALLFLLLLIAEELSLYNSDPVYHNQKLFALPTVFSNRVRCKESENAIDFDERIDDFKDALDGAPRKILLIWLEFLACVIILNQPHIYICPRGDGSKTIQRFNVYGVIRAYEPRRKH
ncbi:hypothetical protein KIN20_024017 [Parelaphostrongylus tenuis]|uniref:Uncharacterized protein n=1 Tax=Parelaphostrongylus tenuis TaxID=148309 RepID=A0AAD5QXJ0_PARTN|nr:hypothetical protein KIN20_024017 [Parelaphostrongylus tenuis]